MTVTENNRFSQNATAVNPLRLVYSACGYHKGRNSVYCFGGQPAVNNTVGLFNGLFSMNAAGLTGATTLFPSIRARRLHGGALLGDSFYVFGGEVNSQSPLSDLWAIDVNANTERQIVNAGYTGDEGVRDLCMAPISQSQFVVWGGNVPLNETHLRYRSKTLIFDSTIGQWNEVTNRIGSSAAATPPYRQYSACTGGTDGRLYVFGGVRDTWYNDVWALDFSTMKWTRLAANGTSDNAPTPRDTPALAMVGKWLVVFGGTNEATNGTTAIDNKFYFFDTTTSQWVTANSVMADVAFLSGSPLVGPPAASIYKATKNGGLPNSSGTVDSQGVDEGSTGAPVGAIVGGVLGALVAVGLAVGGVIMYRRRAATTYASGQPASFMLPPPPRPMSLSEAPSSPYDIPMPQSSYQPQSSYPPPVSAGYQPPVSAGYQPPQQSHNNANYGNAYTTQAPY
ncbi:Acyl-CoA-binding domain-containing protein 5 [Borealophlyctis nickersoniae]|nr:Acyl-CoA-binding domain-containing protein 5 [Borealophlyctis nickersoniae]